jgi:hypothetical protein
MGAEGVPDHQLGVLERPAGGGVGGQSRSARGKFDARMSSLSIEPEQAGTMKDGRDLGEFM